MVSFEAKIEFAWVDNPAGSSQSTVTLASTASANEIFLPSIAG